MICSSLWFREIPHDMALRLTEIRGRYERRRNGPRNIRPLKGMRMSTVH